MCSLHKGSVTWARGDSEFEFLSFCVGRLLLDWRAILCKKWPRKTSCWPYPCCGYTSVRTLATSLLQWAHHSHFMDKENEANSLDERAHTRKQQHRDSSPRILSMSQLSLLICKTRPVTHLPYQITVKIKCSTGCKSTPNLLHGAPLIHTGCIIMTLFILWLLPRPYFGQGTQIQRQMKRNWIFLRWKKITGILILKNPKIRYKKDQTCLALSKGQI